MTNENQPEHADESPESSQSSFGEGPTVIAPPMDIIFHDDDETPLDFVLYLLGRYLNHDEATATEMARRLGEEGKLVVATKPHPFAEALVKRLNNAIAHARYPFKVTMTPRKS